MPVILLLLLMIVTLLAMMAFSLVHVYTLIIKNIPALHFNPFLYRAHSSSTSAFVLANAAATLSWYWSCCCCCCRCCHYYCFCCRCVVLCSAGAGTVVDEDAGCWILILLLFFGYLLNSQLSTSASTWNHLVHPSLIHSPNFSCSHFVLLHIGIPIPSHPLTLQHDFVFND